MNLHPIENKELPSHVILPVLFGVMGGFGVMFIVKFPIPYILLFMFGLLCIGLTVITNRMREALLMFLVFTLIVNIDKVFFMDVNHSGGVEGLNISLWSIFLFILSFLWLIELLNGKSVKIDFFISLSIPLAILFVFTMLSMIKSVNIKLSMFQLIELIKVYLLFFFVANNIRTRTDFKLIIYALCFIFAFEIMIGFYQRITNSFVDLGILSDSSYYDQREIGSQSIQAVSGTMSNDGRFGTYLAAMNPLLLASFISDKRIWLKVVYFILLLCGCILIIFTLSRGAWISIVLAMFLFFILKFYFSKNKLISIAIFILILTTLVFTFYLFRDVILFRVAGNDYGSAESRIPMMEIAFEMIKTNPFLGVGFNNYVVVVSSYDKSAFSMGYYQPVHNAYLQLAAEIGIAGLFVFIIFIINLYTKILKSICQANESERNYLIGLLCGITAILTHHLVNNSTIVTDSFLYFWFFVGLAIALTKIAREGKI